MHRAEGGYRELPGAPSSARVPLHCSMFTMSSVFVREALGDFSALALKALEESDFEKDEHEISENRPTPVWIDPEMAQAWAGSEPRRLPRSAGEDRGEHWLDSSFLPFYRSVVR